MAPMPYNNIGENVAHEMDYMSEDYLTIPENYAGNHFRRRGDGLIIFIWAFVMTFLYIWSEMFYTKFPDEEFYKKPLPPPLDYPNEDATPDTDRLEFQKTLEWKYLYENGSLDPLPFKIIDGKKVFSKYSGLNQPMEFI